MIDAKTKVFGLLANPIGHSLSPRFQNALAAYCGENAVYLPFEVKRPETLEAALKGAHALGIAGLNVTVPYKEAVIPYLSGLSEEARLIGAVNTLVRSEEGYVGHNTDIAGMERMLLRQGLSIRGAKVLVLGAGGGKTYGRRPFDADFAGDTSVFALDRQDLQRGGRGESAQTGAGGASRLESKDNCKMN